MPHSNRIEQQEEPIAIIGIACRFPGGVTCPSELKDLIESPHDFSKTVPTSRFDAESYFHSQPAHHGTTNATRGYFLDESIDCFDAGFFSVQASEAEAIDPQQRLLMEVVYESLCDAGQKVEDMKGSNTAVYVGMMCDDWSQLNGRDWELTPTYAATGTSRAIFSNRVSYFFDWHGPSMTIDTACSSSLVAVHQAVTALRNGESPMAVVAGTNLILSPGMWIAESNLRMLSPTGTSKMWDAAADGYARGEGIAAIIMKPLGAALRDGDKVDCIVRATGINQDGRTAGLTVPSNLAQTQLIRDTYARAGMNINDIKDRPQFFHAHGTGTPAGDPQEAEAISRAFFPEEQLECPPLYVGSIKTVIGHTEGTAGLASVVSTALAMKHGFIPPNLHFNTLSPSVAPYCTHLIVPTKTVPWPEPFPGQPRRASINSFGFGGTNAHAIIENYSPARSTISKSLAQTVFSSAIFSAASPSALRQSLLDVQSYLMDHQDTDMKNLNYTLHSRRTTHAYRTAVWGETVTDIVANIETLLNGDGDDGLSTRYIDVATPNILGVFTGQGAQWPQMGAALIQKSPFVIARLAELDAALSSLPATDRPSWTLREHLMAPKDTSRLSEAAISQPLCTAMQIVLVDLAKAAGLRFQAVVGHSSGEIGAAYASGFISSGDAMLVAYYRGLYAREAQSPSGDKGAMMAVGTTYEDAVEFCALEEFEGRIQVAAQNSPTSVTLSGDEEVIDEALPVLQDEGKFARKLQVDTAYHSRHMLACATQYRDALVRCNIRIRPGDGVHWVSSVLPGELLTASTLQGYGPDYWVDNMTKTVHFASAVATAAESHGPFDLAIELGPHPALKAPCTDSVNMKIGQELPYTSFMGRGKNDVSEVAKALGFIWKQLGPNSVAFERFDRVVSGSLFTPRPLSNLPAYPFDHTRSYGQLSRYSGGHLVPLDGPNPLLGRRLVESETDDQVSWRNVLSSSENSWLQGHALQGMIVFPAMGYVAMAVEAIAAIAGPNRPLGLFGLRDVVIGRALAFEDDRSKMETRVVVTIDRLTNEEFQGRLVCYSGLPHGSTAPFARNFSAEVSATFHESHPDTLSVARVEEINLYDTDTALFYKQFAQLGYNYSAPFTGVTSIKRKGGYATGSIEDISGENWEDQVLIHPGWLDSALQTAFAAFSYPQDNRLWSLHVPVAIGSIMINPHFTVRGAGGRPRKFDYQTVAAQSPLAPVVADIDVFAGEEYDKPFIQIESVEVKPFAQGTAADDTTLFTNFDYRLAQPDGNAVVAGENFYNPKRIQMLQELERVGYFYVRQMHETLTAEEKANALPHFKHFLGFTERIVSNVQKGLLPNIPPEASEDNRSYIQSLIAKHRDSVDTRLLEAAGENIVDTIRQSGSILEYLLADNLLDNFYEDALSLTHANLMTGRILAQIGHRYPGLRVFEVGAGTGGATSQILPALGNAFSMYTYTDISAGFFNRVQDRFREYVNRMTFATFDMDRSPAEQGFEEHTYDVVVASNVLHATDRLDDTIANVRRLLRPGGYLVALEVISNYSLAIDAIFGALPGWWAGAEVASWRRDGPALNVEQWTTLTQKHGFSGVDTHMPISNPLQAFSVLVCQAVDPTVSRLRDPLSVDFPRASQQLVVVGGVKPSVLELVKETLELAVPYFESVIRLPCLEELNKRGLAEGSSVLCLTELDEQLLERRSASKFEALKVLWRNGQNVLWVTQNARAGNPYSAMMMGLCRSVRFEYPHLNLQLLDFDTMPSAEFTMKAVLQLEAAARMKVDGDQNTLWTFEPELHIVKGQMLIPRLYPNPSANSRYNTSRRDVRVDVNIDQTTIELGADTDDNTLNVQIAPPLKSLIPIAAPTISVKIEYSMLQAIKVSTGFLNLCAGKNVDTGESIVALTNEGVNSTSVIPAAWVGVVSTAPDKLVMSTLALHILTQSIVSSNISEEGIILIHNASELLRKSVSKEAAARGILVTFTTSRKPVAKSNQPGSEVYLHENLPRRLIEKVIPRDLAVFVDMSGEDNALSSVLLQSLPPESIKYTATDFIRAKAGHSLSKNDDFAQQTLKTLCRLVARSTPRTSAQNCLPFVSMADVGSSISADRTPTIVDWTTSTNVMAMVKPIDHGVIFRDDGTYWLVGMTGDLGLSVCHWMVSHGARHIVLSSRNPKVHPESFVSLEAFGADIRIMSVDVSDRKSLHECHKRLQADMPPIIGVTNAAMVLEDNLFADVQYDSIERAMLPKVEGSAYLDQLFYSTPLDFFILFTSVSNVMGASGQSTYVMANCFMSALARQRRDIRGVAGSDIAVGSVQGLGYLMRDTKLDRDYFVKRGYRNLSEQDLHQLFAEAILAGRPGHQGSSQVISGVQPFREAHAQLATNPQFQHMRLRDDDLKDGGLGDGKIGAASVRIRLASVKSEAEATDVVQDAFLARLRSILMMPKTEVMDPQTTLVELGADSIMAVDIRAWFLKELNVDLPVLKILGPGETVADLVADSVAKLSSDIFSVEDQDGEDESGVPVKSFKGAEANIELQAGMPSNTDSEKTTSSSRSSASSPLVATTPDTPPELMELENSRLEMQTKKEEWNLRRTTIVNTSSERSELMTLGQKRFWFLSQYVQDPTTFNITYFAKLKGRIRVNDLARSVEVAAQRHEALRTRFFWANDDAKTPMQGILSKPLLQMEVVTIHHVSEAYQAFEDMKNHKWEFDDWAPLRVQLLSLSPTEHFWIVGTHHISMDGFSLSVLMLDIQRAYSAPGQYLAPLAEESQIHALGAQQRRAISSGKLRPALDYYRKVFSGIDFTKPIELFSFAKTQVRSPSSDYATHVTKVHLDASTTNKLKHVARQQRATSFHAYLAALQSFIFCLLDEDTTDQIIIGLSDANRLEKSSMESVGNLINLLPISFKRSRDQTFAKTVQDTRDRANNAMKHSALPFDVLLDELSVPRSAAWTPVFQIYMDYRLVVKEQAAKSWLDCNIEEETWCTARHGYDVLVEVVDSPNGATIAVHVQQALYSEKAAELLARSYANVLKQAADIGPELHTSRLEKWNPGDVQNALTVGRGPSMELEWPAIIADKVDEYIISNANDIALKDAYGRELTYRDLDGRVEEIVSSLEKYVRGPQGEQAVVGVFQQPSIDVVCSLLAIWRLGAIYVPLDLISGTARLQTMVHATQPAVILIDQSTKKRVLDIDETGTIATINVSENVQADHIDTRPARTSPDPDSTAYIMFSSGSSGEPKGIVVSHSGIRAYLEGSQRTWDIGSRAGVVLQQTPLGFDLSISQIFMALCTGGCLVVAPARIRGDPAEMANLILDHGVTLTLATPSEYDMWFRFAGHTLKQCKTWKEAWYSGEPAGPSLLDDFRRMVDSIPELRIVNSYGAVETSIAGFEGEADVHNPALQSPVPCRPLPNYACYIVDKDLKPQPIGVPGEIIFAGLGVAGSRYLHRPDLTSKAFREDNLGASDQKQWQRMYRTGDRGQLDEYGNVTCHGRIDGDTQVKLRGFRIELTEIERVVMQEAAGELRNAIVTTRQDDEGGQFLVVHILFENNNHHSRETQAQFIVGLMAMIRLRLPTYMWPARIVAIDTMPVNSHGKLDRKKMQELSLPQVISLSTPHLGILTPTEQRLVKLWKTLLPTWASIADVHHGTDFFLSGGNSLLLVKLQALIQKEFGDAPRLSQLLHPPELGAMASLLDSDADKIDWDTEIDLQLGNFPRQPKSTKSDGDSGLVIVLTGSTGSLGRRILQELVVDPQVKKVICLVRLAEGRDLHNLFPFKSLKIHIIQTELPILPADDALSEADCILHCAADRNFWDGYNALQPINVDAAKALAQVSIRTGAALHVLSSGAVAAYEDNEENEDSLPRPSSKDGYIATKWVVERHLKRLSRQVTVPITVHRPSEAPFNEEKDDTKYEAAVAQDIVLISRQVGYRPDFANMSGTIDIARLQEVAAAIAQSVVSRSASHTADMTVANHRGCARISIEGLGAHYNSLLQRDENQYIARLPTKSALLWVGDVKQEGLFEWFFTAQDVTMHDQDGNQVVTKR